VLEFLGGVYFELIGDAHVLGTLEHLRINYVGDDGLIFAREVFVQTVDQLLTRHGRFSHGSLQPCSLTRLDQRYAAAWMPYS